MNGGARQLGTIAVAMLVGSCASAGFGTWRDVAATDLAARERLPERVQVVKPDRTIVLEGFRFESDSLVGFELEEDAWRRVALPLEESGELRELELHWGLVALEVLSGTAPFIVYFLLGG